MNGFSSESVRRPFAPKIFTATATVHVRDIHSNTNDVQNGPAASFCNV